MLNLSLTAVARGSVRLHEQILPEDPIWAHAGLKVRQPLQVELEARSVGQGVLVRGTLHATVEAECRRCLRPVEVAVDDTLDLLYEPLTAEEEVELSGEVYPLPPRGDQLDLDAALREQLLLRMPEYVLCSDACRGLCPRCGADLNQGSCNCAPASVDTPWDALKEIRFEDR